MHTPGKVKFWQSRGQRFDPAILFSDGIVSSRHGAKSVHQVCHIGAELMLQKPGRQDQRDQKRQVHGGEHRSRSTDRRFRYGGAVGKIEITQQQK